MPPRDRIQRAIEDRQLVEAGKCQDGTYYLRHRDGAVDLVFQEAGIPTRSSPTHLMVFGEDKAHVARVCVAAICKDRDKQTRIAARVQAGEIPPPRTTARYRGAVDRAEEMAMAIESRYPNLFRSWFSRGDKLDLEGFANGARLVGGEDPKLMEAVDSIVALSKSDRKAIRRRLVEHFEGGEG